MAFIDIKDPVKREQTVQDYIKNLQEIRQRKENQKVHGIQERKNIEKAFQPVVQATEKSTKQITSEIKNLKEKAEKTELESQALYYYYNEFDKSKLDMYYGIYEKDGIYKMGEKKLELDENDNIHIDNITLKGTAGLWRLIMMKKPERYTAEEERDYKELVERTNVYSFPNRAKSSERPISTAKFIILGKLLLLIIKSTGYDSLSNEIIKCLAETNPRIILKLFNLVFDSNAKIEQWAVAILTPILKSGPKMDPSNYRGISILSCLGKLYTAILNKRLMKYAIEQGILKPEALGFVAGNRTSDAHIIIHTLIQRYCHQENRKIFSCFVDFSKAFDTIPRDLLFEKLLGYGITGKFFNNIKSMYTNDNCCVKVGNKLTESFLANQGVKQGCILSPLLFNIFIADIVERFKTENCRPLKIDESQNLGC